jgi:hypothetical protein
MFLHCCPLDRVYRAVAWQCVEKIRYNIKYFNKFLLILWRYQCLRQYNLEFEFDVL